MSNNWQDITDKELADYAEAGLHGQGAVVKSMRRLKVALHREERAIRRLTTILVILTAILVILTVFIVLPEIRALRH